MRSRFFRREHTATAFVMLDTKKCKACWECQHACPNHVIGRINLPWHKHALFVNSGLCVGCMKCVKVCKAGAMSKRFKEQEA